MQVAPSDVPKNKGKLGAEGGEGKESLYKGYIRPIRHSLTLDARYPFGNYPPVIVLGRNPCFHCVLVRIFFVHMSAQDDSLESRSD